MLFHALATHTHIAAPSSSSSASKQRSMSICSDEEPTSSSSGEGGPTPKYGADDFLPVFIYIVLTSDVKDILSNCEYISSYHSPFRLMSRAGYCLVNLQSAAEFIDSLDASSLSIDPEEFAAKMKASSKWKSHVHYYWMYTSINITNFFWIRYVINRIWINQVKKAYLACLFNAYNLA